MKWNLITLMFNSAHISPILNQENTFISFCHPVKPFPGLPSVIRVWVMYAADLFVPISQGTKNGIKYPLIMSVGKFQDIIRRTLLYGVC